MSSSWCTHAISLDMTALLYFNRSSNRALSSAPQPVWTLVGIFKVLLNSSENGFVWQTELCVVSAYSMINRLWSMHQMKSCMVLELSVYGTVGDNYWGRWPIHHRIHRWSQMIRMAFDFRCLDSSTKCAYEPNIPCMGPLHVVITGFATDLRIDSGWGKNRSSPLQRPYHTCR